MILQHIALRFVQPRDDDQLVTGFQSQQRLRESRFDLEPRVRSTLRSLPRRVFPPLQRRTNKANRLQCVRAHLVQRCPSDSSRNRWKLAMNHGLVDVTLAAVRTSKSCLRVNFRAFFTNSLAFCSKPTWRACSSEIFISAAYLRTSSVIFMLHPPSSRLRRDRKMRFVISLNSSVAVPE